jgi:dephospho-CoA kinase
MRDGREILRDLDDASRGVQKASTELSRLITKFGEGYLNDDGEIVEGTKLRYEVAIDEELLRIYEAAVEQGKRAPAEDVRGAMARSAVRSKHPQLFADYKAQQTRIEALRLWLSNQKAVISGYQSLRRGEAA